MGLIYLIKKHIILKTIKKVKALAPFNLEVSENYQLPTNASGDQINDYYLFAHTLEGESLVVRKTMYGDGRVEVWVVYHSQEATYSNKHTTYQNETGPLSINLIEAGKTWSFKFNGILNKMRIDETKLATFTNEELAFEISGLFNSETPVFDVRTQMDEELYANAIAKEKWNPNFRDDLIFSRQEQVKQQGMMTAKIKRGEIESDFKAYGLRIHAYGLQDWTRFNRHIAIMTIIRKGELLDFARLNHQSVNNLITGYYEKDGRVEQIAFNNSTASIPVLGTIPEHFKYRVELRNAITFDIRTTVEVIIPYVVSDGNYAILLGIAAFDANKRKTRGMMEFGFNGDDKKWQGKE